MKNIYILPTDKPSRLGKFIDTNNLFLRVPNDIPRGENVNIYITNDEKIKKGDWFINVHINSNYIDKRAPEASYRYAMNSNAIFSNPKKIILTTDQDLDGVQAIDDEFLEWFVKNPNCEEVETIIEYKDGYGNWFEYNKEFWDKHGNKPKFGTRYKIIIPKEEPKQEIVGYRLKPSIDRRMIDAILKNSMPIWNDEDKSVYFIRGHVAGSLVARMKELQVLDLWFTPIYEFEEVKSDWIKQNHLDYYYKEGIMSNKPKQETLEKEWLKTPKWGVRLNKDKLPDFTYVDWWYEGVLYKRNMLQLVYPNSPSFGGLKWKVFETKELAEKWIKNPIIPKEEPKFITVNIEQKFKLEKLIK